MRWWRDAGLWVAALGLLACASEDGAGGEPGPNAAPGQYATCASDEEAGSFAVILGEDVTTVQGEVADAVVPLKVQRVEMEQGGCRLLRPAALGCDGGGGACGETPRNQSVGSVTLSGLAAPVEMEPRKPSQTYFDNSVRGIGFEPGATVVLSAAGTGEVSPFSLAAVGVAPLETPTDPVPLARDEPAQVTWTPRGADPAVAIEIVLNIANHGGTPGHILCTVEDSGSFQVPVELSNALFDLGYSGFPSLEVARKSAARVQTDYGCVELSLSSTVRREVEIPGLVSCSGADPDECPAGQTCDLQLLACS